MPCSNSTREDCGISKKEKERLTIMKNAVYRNRVPLICAFIQWCVTVLLQVDRAFFIYEYKTKYYLVVKFLYLILLMVTWCFGFHAYRKIKEQNADYQRGLQVFLTYLTIMLGLLLILWPGTWSWDDINTLDGIREYRSFFEWQNIVTGIYQDVMLQILPFPGGLILLQNVIISLCVAFCVTKLEKAFSIKRLKNRLLDILLKLLPFFLPPVLMYQFSGYRMGLYVYLELTMLVMLICAATDESQWSWSYTALFCFLTVIVSVWRTESFLYIPCAAVLLLFVKKTTLNRKKKCVCVLLSVFGFLAANRLQNDALGDSNYQVASLMRPCTELVRAADWEEDAAELAAIDRVTDLAVIRDNPTANGEELFWNTGCVRNTNDDPADDYTEEDYSNFLKAFIKLSLKYPGVVIAERWNVFVAGSGITGKTISNVSSATLFDEDDPNTAGQRFQASGYLVNMPAFPRLRKIAINLLSGRNADGSENGVLQRLLWNAIIPMLALLFAWVNLLLKKKWYLWLVCSAVVVKIPLIVLTQPASWLMYLLSLYFLGYVYIVYKTWIRFS